MTQENLFGNLSESSQVDTHANHSQQVAKDSDKKILDTSFRASMKLLNKLDPLIAFTKTYMGTSPWDLTRYSLQWKTLTTKRGHLLFRLQVSEQGTKGTESGSSVKTWATPTTMDSLPPRSAEATKRMQEGARKGRKRPSNLREQVDPKTMEMYPTPTTKGFGHASEGQTMIFRKKVERGELSENEAQSMMNGVTLRPPRMEKWDYPKKEMFPTPSANEDAAGRPGGKMQKMLGNHPSVRDQSSGTLNPTWVEWLMGYPTGYTDCDV